MRTLPIVNTTRGPVAVDDLGVTYMHEHIFCTSVELQAAFPGFGSWPEAQHASAVQWLTWLKEDQGVSTILDATAGGVGRQLRAIARVAEESGMNVIVCTGWYTTRELPPTLVRYGVNDLADLLAEWFVRDIEEGMEGTAIRAGALKCCVDTAGVTPNVEAVLRGVARAHVVTGAPITTHTDASLETGADQQRIFAEEGVDLSRVIIGHTNQSGNRAYIERLMDEGSYVGYDRVGRARPNAPVDQQHDILAELIRRGYGDRIVLSHDDTVYADLLDVDGMRALLGLGDTYPYGFIRAAVIPELRARGITEEAIRALVVDNPRRLFAKAGGQDAEHDRAGRSAV